MNKTQAITILQNVFGGGGGGADKTYNFNIMILTIIAPVNCLVYMGIITL